MDEDASAADILAKMKNHGPRDLASRLMEERARPGPYLLFTLAGWSGPVVVFAEAGNEGRGKKTVVCGTSDVSCIRRMGRWMFDRAPKRFCRRGAVGKRHPAGSDLQTRSTGRLPSPKRAFDSRPGVKASAVLQRSCRRSKPGDNGDKTQTSSCLC